MYIQCIYCGGLYLCSASILSVTTASFTCSLTSAQTCLKGRGSYSPEKSRRGSAMAGGVGRGTSAMAGSVGKGSRYRSTEQGGDVIRYMQCTYGMSVN